MKSKDLFFRDDKFIGWFFARPGITLSTFLGSGIAICLSAWSVHLGSIVGPNGCNVGFFYRPNWALMYLVLLPTIFCLMSSILAQSTSTVEALSSQPIRIIEPSLTNKNELFEDSLSVLMGKWKPWIYSFSLGPALIITVWTVVLLLWKPSVTGEDWAVVMPRFAVFIFIVQGVYIFLGVFWVLKFASFIASFIRITLREPAGFRLNPMLYDPEHRLGLGMVGRLLNRFAVAALFFESYVALYGLQAAADIQNACLVKYVQNKFIPAKSESILLHESFPGLFNFSGAGVWILFALSFLLWIVYIAIPMFYLRPRLGQMRKEAWRDHARELESANQDNDETRTKRLEREFKALRASSSWPNGPRAGIALMISLLVMPLLASPLGPYLVGLLKLAYEAIKLLG